MYQPLEEKGEDMGDLNSKIFDLLKLTGLIIAACGALVIAIVSNLAEAVGHPPIIELYNNFFNLVFSIIVSASYSTFLYWVLYLILVQLFCRLIPRIEGLVKEKYLGNHYIVWAIAFLTIHSSISVHLTYEGAKAGYLYNLLIYSESLRMMQ